MKKDSSVENRLLLSTLLRSLVLDLLLTGELDTLASGEAHVRLASLANDKLTFIKGELLLA